MTSSRTRLVVLSGAFLTALGILLVHLFILMVQEQEVWARRSYENRWAFRSVPSQRGQLFDRNGELLAWDEPTTRASIYYRRFRVYHVVGAAVHGATHWASLRPHQVGTTYTIENGVLGPRVAAEDLLSIPVRALQSGVLSKSQFSPLVRYATTVLSVCSGMPRKKVYAAMRKAAQVGANIGIGDVLPMSRAELLQRFDERLQSLHELNGLFEVAQQNYNLRLGRTTVDPTLLGALERLRRDSLEKRKVVIGYKKDKNDIEERDTDGNRIPVRWGSLVEDMRRYFAHDVEFELAAALRVDRTAHPGIGVEPSIRRVRRGGRETSLGVMIGEVRSNDRLVWEDKDKDGKTVKHGQPSSMPEEWQEELVPDDVVGNEEALEHMRKEAERRFQRETLVNERSGISGMESLCDKSLTGKLGMRFVEHDSRRREHRLWSHLRVESGKDAHVTIDVGLQEIAELAVRQADANYRGRYSEPKDLAGLESALAIIDAHTGDILALAGAPVRPHPKAKGSTLRVPGLIWQGNGSIGSVVKPFILLEHLESKRLGRPYRAEAEMNPCQGFVMIGGRKLNCDWQHWEEGRSAVPALAKSCNGFFYQAGDGLGVKGVWRALRRFGLSKPPEGDPFFECWQPLVRGVQIGVPGVDPGISLVRRAIGYGVQVAPLHIARAYAGIATGVLPDVGLRLGEPRRYIPLGDIGESLEVVREGMARCVRSGTARAVELRDDWDVHAKTGTAEIYKVSKQNNGWFAGYMPWTGLGGTQLVFCAVVYRVPSGVHGGEAAGGMVADFLKQVERNPDLNLRYLTK
ncbi:MAG: penicillin-binding protein 2 [Neolewinella sp.]